MADTTTTNLALIKPAIGVLDTTTDWGAKINANLDAIDAILNAATPSSQNFGDSASAGVSLVAARSDHKHGLPNPFDPISASFNVVIVLSSPVTLASGNIYLVSTATIPITLNLFAPAGNSWFFVKDSAQNAYANNITIHRYGSEKIDGISADLILPASNGSWFIVSDGTNWYSVAMGGDLVLNDISNGHTYRVLMQNGVLSTQQVN